MSALSINNYADVISQAAELLRASRSILFITGAGISADSGLPTYRGIGGLYTTQTDDGTPIEELLSGRTLLRQPEVLWKHIGQVESACRGARFNRGHEIIAKIEKLFPRVW